MSGDPSRSVPRRPSATLEAARNLVNYRHSLATPRDVGLPRLAELDEVPAHATAGTPTRAAFLSSTSSAPAAAASSTLPPLDLGPCEWLGQSGAGGLMLADESLERIERAWQRVVYNLERGVPIDGLGVTSQLKEELLRRRRTDVIEEIQMTITSLSFLRACLRSILSAEGPRRAHENVHQDVTGVGIPDFDTADEFDIYATEPQLYIRVTQSALDEEEIDLEGEAVGEEVEESEGRDDVRSRGSGADRSRSRSSGRRN